MVPVEGAKFRVCRRASPEVREAIVAARLGGMPYLRIARVFGVPYTTVRRICVKAAA